MNRWQGGALAAGVAVSVAVLTACGPSADDGPRATDRGSSAPSAAEATAAPSGRDPWRELEIPASDYTGWTPTLRDVRAWSSAEADVLIERIDAADRRTYTAGFDLEGLTVELSHTATHDRVRIGQDWLVEAHYDGEQDVVDGMLFPKVTCMPGDGRQPAQCVRLTGEEDSGGAPHLFNNFIDSMLFSSSILVATQSSRSIDYQLPDDVKGARLALADVDSPAGPLDCVVVLPEGTTPAEAEGHELALEPDPMMQAPVATCVDRRGLVILAPTLLTVLNPLTSLRPEVDDDVDSYPAEVRDYG